MPFEFLRHLYAHLRNTLIWFLVYFIFQAAIWVALALLVWYYPQALFIIVVVCFLVVAAVSLYFAVLFARYIYKLKKIKDLISWE